MLRLWFFATAVMLAPLVAAARAEDPSRTVDPREFGLDLPPGPMMPGANQCVTTNDDNGQPFVGRVHVRVGSSAVILLPDGELVGRREGEFASSDRKFEPLTKEQLSSRLAAEFPDFKIKSTNHYIYAYSSSEEFQFGTSRILETMLPGVKGWAEGCRIDVKNPSLPLVVVMFKNEADFRRYRRMPIGVVAYYDPLSNRVFMYEHSRLSQVRPDLALGQAISTIAHEGVHQILHNIGVQQRLSVWPLWLSEGLAEFFAPTTVGAKLRWKGPGQVNDLRMFELEQYLKSPAADDASGEMVEHTVLYSRFSSADYAKAWALVHYLAKYRKPELTALIREASQLGPFAGATEVNALGVVRSNRDSFARQCGDNFKDLESRIVAHLKKQPYNRPFP
jgi:hypothetical protein